MKIVIFQPMLKQYRVPLFDRMGQMLNDKGHELRVVCGTPPKHELSKGDNVVSNLGVCIVEKSVWLFSGKLHILYHSVRHILWADFVITEQANKHLHNYILIFLRVIRLKKFAYWGHGQNRQGSPRSWREKIKKKLSTQCDWWFSYTEGVANYIASLGYPASNITVLNNSIDTSKFKEVLSAQSEEDVAAFKQQLAIDEDARIGLFCGSLYSEKKIEFLLQSALDIYESNSNFVLLVVGSGESRSLVEEFASRYSFIKFLGPLFSEKKALAFKSAELFLCPGLVGLAILDAFVAGLPLFTTDIPNHSPEIEYLQSGYNGEMTMHLQAEYSRVILDVLSDPTRLNGLRQNSLTSGDKFSIGNMAQNFVDGIQSHFQASI
ncbi:MAG: hypothetical protein BVN35_05660 [Proteobacteria bacterium ST_bin11]|nr:MAG: hypothetical protein BVN35_05660 [Proteobacteria bacterium ST_bin11]